MKKLVLLFFVAFACSCTNSTKTSTETADSSATTLNYPYTIKNPDNWEIGSTTNTMIALSALKEWENGDMDKSLKYFGDSIRVQFNSLDKKMSNDGLKVFLGDGFNSFKTVKEKMNDWESVISKDKSEEWVTLWYTQIFEEKTGVKDSLSIVNDIQIKDGKIIRLSEYTRKFH